VRVEFRPMAVVAEARRDETLLDVARRSGVPLGSSCGGVGVCARCVVSVCEGLDGLTPPTTIERRMAGEGKLDLAQRLACQAVVTGECAVTTDYW
jgi:ferredoxin, 2Fe-2S